MSNGFDSVGLLRLNLALQVVLARRNISLASGCGWSRWEEGAAAAASRCNCVRVEASVRFDRLETAFLVDLIFDSVKTNQGVICTRLDGSVIIMDLRECNAAVVLRILRHLAQHRILSNLRLEFIGVY
jgi:hypothetical protein